MDKEILKRVPKVPNWRHILYIGRSHPDYTEEFAQLERYLKEEGKEIDLDDEYLEDALYIMSVMPMKRVVDSALIEGIKPKSITDILYHKFNHHVTKEVVETYANFFCDTEVVNNYDLAWYFGDKMPKPAPVPGYLKNEYAAYKYGLEPDIDLDRAIMNMFSRAFFRANELAQFGWAADDKVLKYQNQAMAIYKTLKEENANTELPEEFRYEVEYPEQTAVSIEDLPEGAIDDK